jgi:hypothetical protein
VYLKFKFFHPIKILKQKSSIAILHLTHFNMGSRNVGSKTFGLNIDGIFIAYSAYRESVKREANKSRA